MSRRLFAIAMLIAAFFVSETALADRGVVVLANSRCFVVETTMGYVLVDGWVNVPKGATVIANFSTYGSTPIFDVYGNDVSGYIYIEDWGLSKTSVLEKWASKCS